MLYHLINNHNNNYTALQKFGNTPGKVWFWTISHFQAVQILLEEETVSWHHVCHGMASTITRPQPN